MDAIRFDKRVVIVTGAGSGIGREYALLFGKRGASVVVNDLGGDTKGGGTSSKAADAVVEEIKQAGGTAIADYNSVVEGHKIIENAMANFGRVDVLVNNAGILRDKSLARISEQDWDLVHNVHLKGCFKTIQAAWPIFKKQNYGRIIVTTSNSGLHGNFGQANYSAAKLGLVGLSKTVAIEGQKNNINCNAIVPTAASRLTKGILPDELFDALKPELIAPYVVYLCHESCTENGQIIESAAGWAANVRICRSKGMFLGADPAKLTPENVRDSWPQIMNMKNPVFLESIHEASADIMRSVTETASNELSSQFDFSSKEAILYALGVGASVKKPEDFKYMYENNADFSVLPSFFILPGLMWSLSHDLMSSALKHTSVDLTQVFHGEQYLKIEKDLPTSGHLTTEGGVIDTVDKGSGAIVVTECVTKDEYGNIICTNQSAIFVAGAGNFNGKRNYNENVIPLVATPKENPTHTALFKTNEDQAALYRLSGDLNPMHIDPMFSAIAGFKVPILHGLCTLGITVREILNKYSSNVPDNVVAFKVRFAKPVTPGHTLQVNMWKRGNRIHFTTTTKETNVEVLSGGYVDLKSTTNAKL